MKKLEKLIAETIKKFDARVEDMGVYINGAYLFSLSEDPLPFCCGVYEIGDFSVNLCKIPKKDVLLLVAGSLLKVIDNHTLGKQRMNMIVNLVDSPSCNLVKEAIETYLADRFVVMPPFENRNSGNKITTYIQYK
jgi:Tfp pilus assembly protein PilZ